jgi:hypothetical protein
MRNSISIRSGSVKSLTLGSRSSNMELPREGEDEEGWQNFASADGDFPWE